MLNNSPIYGGRAQCSRASLERTAEKFVGFQIYHITMNVSFYVELHSSFRQFSYFNFSILEHYIISCAL